MGGRPSDCTCGISPIYGAYAVPERVNEFQPQYGNIDPATKSVKLGWDSIGLLF